MSETLADLGVNEIVYAVRDHGPDGHWYANFGYYARSADRKAYRSGGRLCKLNVHTGETTRLIDDPDGSVRDPVVHYDAGKILFSWRRSGTESFHLYEVNLDGSNLRQLTDGIYDDIEPTYLPCGDILFVSSRCRRWVNCWLTQVATLYRCDGDGADIRPVSANIEHDNTPWVLPDGRVLYQRWEYVDRSQVHYHHLWTVNPDGTGQMTYFGNLHGGGVFIDAKPIPGTGEVVLIHSPGHGQREHAGQVAIVSPEMGPDFRPSMRELTRGKSYRDPYPLSADDFLAAQGRRLLLVNRNGKEREVFKLGAEFGGAELHEPRPVVARIREAVIPDRAKPGNEPGRLLLQDVYVGRNMAGVKRGEIRKLLVMETLAKPINYTGGMEPLTYGGSFTLERVVGAVPVEADGSAYMALPANRAFFFIALDEQDRSVKRMQSFVSVMPGETTGCVGCHEERVTTGLSGADRGALTASRRDPSIPLPVEGIPDVFDYPRDIQPLWDRHCVRCHNPDNRQGGVLMTGDQGPMFSHSYFMLAARRQVADGRNLPRSNYAPRAIGDCASPLMAKLEASHHDVNMPEREKRLVRYWIHAGAPWPGTYAALGCGMVGGYDENRIDTQDQKWESMKKAAEVLNRRCLPCHANPRRPLPRSPSDNMGMPPWAIQYGSPKLRFSRHILYNLSRPEKSVLLLAPLARSAGGWAESTPERGAPEAKVCPRVFETVGEADYILLLEAIRETADYLRTIKRFNMPGFRPTAAYVREMKRYGILPEAFDLEKDPVDVYDLDRKYWEALW